MSRGEVLPDGLSEEVERIAGTYRERASWGDDDKRHDRILNDEADAMLEMKSRYGYSYEHIARIFNRDKRTVENSIELAMDREAGQTPIPIIEKEIEVEPDSRIFFDIELPANVVMIHRLDVEADENCGFDFRIYDSSKYYSPATDPYGLKLKKSLVAGPGRLPLPMLYVDRDRTRKLHCDITYLQTPVTFGIPAKEKRRLQTEPRTFTVTVLYEIHKTNIQEPKSP